MKFWENVDKLGPDDCWMWKGSRFNTNYGLFSMGRGKVFLAHRYSWYLATGRLPENVLILHKCHNRPCVNPAHLYEGTYSDNRHDVLRAKLGLKGGPND